MADGHVYGGDPLIVVDTRVCAVERAPIVGQASVRPLAAADANESEKDSIYLELCKARGFKFLPAVFESYGALGSRLGKQMQDLQKQYEHNHPESYTLEGKGAFIGRWRMRFSVCFQTAMARKIAKHCHYYRQPLSIPVVAN